MASYKSDVVKTMEKLSHVWVLKHFSSTKKLKLGQSIQSDLIRAPGDYSFRLFCYPQGKHQHDLINKSVCIRIQNESTKPVEFVFSIEILRQPYARHSKDDHDPSKCSQFDDREAFRHVGSLEPGLGFDFSHFKRCILERGDYIWRSDTIKIEVTIGVFIDRPRAIVPRLLDPFVFFKVGDAGTVFYAEESVLRERSPALLPPPGCSGATATTPLLPPSGCSGTTRVVRVRDIDPRTFGALLWYIYHKKLHRDDRKIISRTNWHDPNAMGIELLAEARRLNLQHLTKLLNALLGFHNTTFGKFGDIFRGLFKCATKADKKKVKQIVIKTESTTYADGYAKEKYKYIKN